MLPRDENMLIEREAEQWRRTRLEMEAELAALPDFTPEELGLDASTFALRMGEAQINGAIETMTEMVKADRGIE